MARTGVHVRTMLVHSPRIKAAVVRAKWLKGLYLMNIHEMASFLLSGL